MVQSFYLPRQTSIGYALNLAESVGDDAAVAKIAESRLREAQDRGWGHLYSPAIYKLYED